MNTKNFFVVFKESPRGLYKNPQIFIFAAALWGIFRLLSFISVQVNYHLTTTIPIVAWLIVFSIISLAIMSFFFSGIIGFTGEAIHKKAKFRSFFSSGKKFFLRNFLVLLIIALLSIAVGRIAHYAALYIGLFLSLQLNYATALFVLIYFLELIFIVMFFTFAIFFVVLKNETAFKGIKSSFKFVKKEFLATLSLSVILFIFLFLLNKLGGFYAELVEYLIIIPFVAFIFSRFVLENSKN
jgi:hypothetical protein